MVKILIKRRFKPGNTKQIVALFNKLRSMAMEQPGYVSGETLYAHSDPHKMLVISVWRSLEDWDAWKTQEDRKSRESMLEIYQQGPTEYEVYEVGVYAPSE